MSNSKHFRILAVAPSTRGFGFAVLEGAEKLVDWGAKSVKGEKNARSLASVGRMINHYQPDGLVLPDVAKNARRASRIKALNQEIARLAEDRKITVSFLSNKQVKRRLLANGQGTKYAVAEILAKRFEEEIGSYLPPKRLPWMSEDRRMDIFEAVALVVAFRLKTTIPITSLNSYK